MKKLNIIKITLDMVMVVVFALLYNKMVIAGLTFHKIAGLAVGGMVFIHLLLNSRWIKKVTFHLFSKNVQLKTRIGYAVDVLLLICLAVILISGAFISKTDGIFNWSGIHIGTSYATLLLIGTHLGLHWTWVMNTAKKIFKIKNDNKITALAARVMVVFVLLFGAYSCYSVNYVSKISSMVSASAHQGQRGDFENRTKRLDRDLDESQDLTAEKAEGQVRQSNQAQSQGLKENGEGFNRSEGRHRNGGSNQTNVGWLITTILSIIAMFAAIEYYLEKMIVATRIKKVKRLSSEKM